MVSAKEAFMNHLREHAFNPQDVTNLLCPEYLDRLTEELTKKGDSTTCLIIWQTSQNGLLFATAVSQLMDRDMVPEEICKDYCGILTFGAGTIAIKFGQNLAVIAPALRNGMITNHIGGRCVKCNKTDGTFALCKSGCQYKACLSCARDIRNCGLCGGKMS